MPSRLLLTHSRLLTGRGKAAGVTGGRGDESVADVVRTLDESGYGRQQGRRGESVADVVKTSGGTAGKADAPNSSRVRLRAAARATRGIAGLAGRASQAGRATRHHAEATRHHAGAAGRANRARDERPAA